VVDRSARRWTQTSPKNLNMDSSDENAFVRIMYFLDEMVSTSTFYTGVPELAPKRKLTNADDNL
jgi:hypothetical protein